MTLDRVYITPEIARLLKEVSYNYETEKIWYDSYSYPEGTPHLKAKLLWKDALNQDQRDWPEYQYPAPEQWEVEEWLRQEYKLSFILEHINTGECKWIVEIQMIPAGMLRMYSPNNSHDYPKFNDPRTAKENAILFALEYIKSLKQNE